MGLFNKILGVVSIAAGVALAFATFGGASQLSALLISAGLGLLSHEFLAPKQPDTPDVTRSLTLSTAPAQNVIGRAKVRGMLHPPSPSESKQEILGTVYYVNKDYIYVRYTIANHSLWKLNGFFMHDEYFKVIPHTNLKGKINFNLDTSLDSEEVSSIDRSRLNSDYKSNMEIYINFSGDNTDNKNPAFVPTEATQYIPNEGGENHISWVLIAFKNNKSFWNDFQRGVRWDPVGVSFDVTTKKVSGFNAIDNNASRVLRDFLIERLEMSMSDFDVTSYNKAYQVCKDKNRLVNGFYTENNLEGTLNGLFEVFNGRIDYRKDGKLHLVTSEMTNPSFTITEDMLIADIQHNVKGEIQNYANTARAEINDIGYRFKPVALDDVTNEQAIRDDGKRLLNDIGTLRFINNQTQAKQFLTEHLARMAAGSRLQLVGTTRHFSDINIYDRGYFRYLKEGFDGTDIYRVESKAEDIDGRVVLELVADPDDVYTLKEVDLTLPPTDYTPIYHPDLPFNVQSIETIDNVNVDTAFRREITWTNPSANTGTRLEVFIVEEQTDNISGVVVEQKSLFVEVVLESGVNRYSVVGLSSGQSIRVELWGRLLGRETLTSTSYLFTVGQQLPLPDRLVNPVISYIPVMFLLQINVLTGNNTDRVEVRYRTKTNSPATETDWIQMTELGIFGVISNNVNTYQVVFDRPGEFEFVLRPYSRHNKQGSLSSVVYNIITAGTHTTFEEAPDWEGTKTNLFNIGPRLKEGDYEKAPDHMLFITTDEEAQNITNEEWQSSDPDVFPFKRKTSGTASYLTPWREFDNPTIVKNFTWNHSARVCNFFNAVDFPYTWWINTKETSSSTVSRLDPVVGAVVVNSSVIHSWQAGISFDIPNDGINSPVIEQFQIEVSNRNV